MRAKVYISKIYLWATVVRRERFARISCNRHSKNSAPHGERNKLEIVMTGRYLKHTRETSAGKISSPHIANVLFDSWIVSYAIPNHVRTEYGVQFTIKLFATLYAILVLRHLKTTAYDPWTSGLVEGYNPTIVTRRLYYDSENQKKGDRYVQPLSYVYNTQKHKSTNTLPFSLVLQRLVPGPIKVAKPSGIASKGYVGTVLT